MSDYEETVTKLIRKYGKCERVTEWVRRQEEERDGKTTGM